MTVEDPYHTKGSKFEPGVSSTAERRNLPPHAPGASDSSTNVTEELSEQQILHKKDADASATLDIRNWASNAVERDSLSVSKKDVRPELSTRSERRGDGGEERVAASPADSIGLEVKSADTSHPVPVQDLPQVVRRLQNSQTRRAVEGMFVLIIG